MAPSQPGLKKGIELPLNTFNSPLPSIGVCTVLIAIDILFNYPKVSYITLCAAVGIILISLGYIRTFIQTRSPQKEFKKDNEAMKKSIRKRKTPS